MATTWTVKQEAIRLAIATALDVPDRLGADELTYIKDVEWENKRDANDRWDHDAPVVDLRLGPVRSKGNDERRDVYDEDADRIRTYYCGNRLFTVTVTCKRSSQEAGQETVGEVGSKLRTRMRADPIHALYEAGDVACVWVEETQNADELEINGRAMSVSVTDIRFATVEEWEMNDTAAGDFIERVDGTGELVAARDADGEPDIVVDADFDTARLS